MCLYLASAQLTLINQKQKVHLPYGKILTERNHWLYYIFVLVENHLLSVTEGPQSIKRGKTRCRCVVGGRFIGMLHGVSIEENTTESPKGLEPGMESFRNLVCLSLPLLPLLLPFCMVSHPDYPGHQSHSPISIDLLSLPLIVHN